MTIATLKDFEIENIEEDYYTGTEFQGTWADNTCELCDVTIEMEHNDKYYQLTIKPADPGDYGSYGGDWGRGKGISTEILIDIIQQLTDEPEQVTFENFVNRYFNKYGFSHEVALVSSKNKYYFNKPDKRYLGKPINLVTEQKTVKKFMPIYTYEQLTPENITQIVGEDFIRARSYAFDQIFEELNSENEYIRTFWMGICWRQRPSSSKYHICILPLRCSQRREYHPIHTKNKQLGTERESSRKNHRRK